MISMISMRSSVGRPGRDGILKKMVVRDKMRAQPGDALSSCGVPIYPRSTIALVAKFAFEVLELFYAVPVFRLNASEVVLS